MTCIEKWKQDHPDEDEKWAICNLCPHDIGIDLYGDDEDCGGKCADCWDRKIPGTEEKSGLQGAVEKIQKCVIKDSGSRTEFDTGAVRDIQEGKGRCDLMPLDVVSDLYMSYFGKDDQSYKVTGLLHMFTQTGDCLHLHGALGEFLEESDFGGWSSLFLEVAKHFEEGAKKYGENNWQKGLPVKCYINSAVRHYLKWLRGDKDEPHDRAFCWNILCAIWTCKHKPELNDYRKENEHADN